MNTCVQRQRDQTDWHPVHVGGGGGGGTRQIVVYMDRGRKIETGIKSQLIYFRLNSHASRDKYPARKGQHL
jgi:hypothetical protein